MSKSYRDQKNYDWKHHRCGQYAWSCDCWPWDYRFYNFPPPSWWNRDIRRKERAFTRNKMQRARVGSIDWADVDQRRGDEWYW